MGAIESTTRKHRVVIISVRVAKAPDVCIVLVDRTGDCASNWVSGHETHATTTRRKKKRR